MALFPDGKTNCFPTPPSASTGKEVEIWSAHSLRGDAVRAQKQVWVVRDEMPHLAERHAFHRAKKIEDWRVIYRVGPNVWHDMIFMSFDTVWAHIGRLLQGHNRYNVTLISPTGRVREITLKKLPIE